MKNSFTKLGLLKPFRTVAFAPVALSLASCALSGPGSHLNGDYYQPQAPQTSSAGVVNQGSQSTPSNAPPTIVEPSAYVCVRDINATNYAFHIVSPDDEITHKTIKGLDRDGVSPIIKLNNEEAIEFTQKDDMFGYIFAAYINTEKGICGLNTEKTGHVNYQMRDAWLNGTRLRRIGNGFDFVSPDVTGVTGKIPFLNKIPGFN